MSDSLSDAGLTGMADAVLSEIATRAKTFCESGEAASIELTAMPLTRRDREAIETRLGRGELTATIDAAGRSEVWETAYAGVWFVRSLGAVEQIATETIEICAAPEILFSHSDDRRAAAARLAEEFSVGAARVE